MENNYDRAGIVISSRIRLARNVSGTPFPTMMTDQQGADVVRKVTQAIAHSPATGVYRFLAMDGLDELTRLILVEKHLASVDLVRNSATGALLVSDDETGAIMINEEDHLRIQAIFPGLDLQKAARQAYAIEGYIAGEAPYAFDSTLGYLCTCLTNVGTGLRASVMMHLPAIRLTGQVKTLLDSVMKAGLAVRGTYGEGSQPLGDMYQISNRTTLGASEEEFIAVVEQICGHLAQKELQARNILMEKHQLSIEDRVMRSWGVLKFARSIGEKEFMRVLSDTRLGVGMGIIDGIDLQAVDKITLAGQPAMVQKISGRLLDNAERDSQRANVIKNILKDYNQ